MGSSHRTLLSPAGTGGLILRRQCPPVLFGVTFPQPDTLESICGAGAFACLRGASRGHSYRSLPAAGLSNNLSLLGPRFTGIESIGCFAFLNPGNTRFAKCYHQRSEGGFR